MNYAYQLVGIQAADSAGSSVPDPALRRLDYSTMVLPTGGNTPGALDESMLDEVAGLGSGTADLFHYIDGTCTPRLAATTGPVDWDGDGDLTNRHATADLNPQDHLDSNCGDITNAVLNGHVDWGPAPGESNFTYPFQCTSFGDYTTAAPSSLPLAPEMSAHEAVHQLLQFWPGLSRKR
jgi:hypothetical protein